VRNAGWLRGGAARAGLYRFFMAVFTSLTPPVATAFWCGLANLTTSIAQRARMIYTGNAQAYNLYIVYYFVFLYIAGGGIRG